MDSLPINAKIISSTPSETEMLASRFYKMLKPGSVVALYGQLGAGKTTFVRGLAVAAGVDRDEVKSPSFTLINEYPGADIPIFHFDLYRIVNPSEFYAIGADEYFSNNGLVLIEWAENGLGFIPEKRFEVYFDIIDESRRSLFLKEVG